MRLETQAADGPLVSQSFVPTAWYLDGLNVGSLNVAAYIVRISKMLEQDPILCKDFYSSAWLVISWHK